MIRIAGRCRDAVRRIRARSLRPAVEGLEDRKLLATINGGHWYYPIRITYSFMPDGTSIGGVSSNLFQTMNAVAPTATWQDQFRKAAAIWQQVAGFNIVEVTDNGDPVGGTGNQQNDSRFGDIRIGGTAMHPAYLGYSLLPPPVNGGPDAGDIVINTAQTWKINNDYDLLSVAIHEIGHSLGMGHSAITAANMYTYYAWMKQSLHSDDVAGIQYLYGGVPADPTANSTLSTAIDLTSLTDAQGRMSYGAGYVTQASNFEWYKITVPSSTTGTMKVTMQSTSLSSLSPWLTVVNSAYATVGTVSAPDVFGATVTYTVTGVTPGQTYYIQGKAAQSGAGSNGAFGLLVNFGTSTQAPIAPYNTTVAQQPDQGVNGWMPEMTPREMRRAVRRFQNLNGPDQANDDHGHETIVINLGKGRGKAYADALMATPRRPSRFPRFPRPARFRHA